MNFNFQGVIQIQLLYSINMDFNATLNECVKSLPFTDRLIKTSKDLRSFLYCREKTSRLYSAYKFREKLDFSVVYFD